MSSSKEDGPYKTVGGIFSNVAEESTLANANKAFLRYCTSDVHVGSKTVSDSDWKFKFRGEDGTRAFIDHLI